MNDYLSAATDIKTELLLLLLSGFYASSHGVTRIFVEGGMRSWIGNFMVLDTHG